MTAISESTPGPIATNSATYIGYRIAGIAGAAVSTLAVCIPSFVVIYIISLFLTVFLSSAMLPMLSAESRSASYTLYRL